MSFSTDMDRALNGMVTGQKAAVKSAFTTVQASLATEQSTYGTKNPEKIALNERLLALARDIRSEMR